MAYFCLGNSYGE